MPNGMTTNLYLPTSVLNIVRYEEAWSNVWCQYPFLQSHTVSMQASASMWEMSSGVQKWYGSLITALFKLVGSRQILNLTCPWLSLFSTRTKLLIHSVASVTGSKTLACSIWLISFWNVSFRWIGMGLHGVCFGVTFGSTWMWYGSPGNLPIPSKMSGYSCKICSWLVISVGGVDVLPWMLWHWLFVLVITSHFCTWVLFLFFLGGLHYWLLG